MGWHRGLLAALDLETDAKDPEDARLITSTCVRVDPDGARHMQRVAQPERDIPEEAANVHGYPTERAQAEGRPREDVITDMRGWLTRWWSPARPLVIYNAPYDLTVLDREFRRVLGHGLVLQGPVVDPLLLDKVADKWRKGSRKLVDTCAHYGVDLAGEDAHSSLFDTYAAGRLMTAILDKYAWMQRMGPSKLHQRQIGWYHDNAVDLLAYWRKSPTKHPDVRNEDGTPGPMPTPDVIDSWTVSTEWPVRAYQPDMETASG